MSLEKPRILYFAPEWPASSSGVLHSTVLAEASYLQRNGLDCFFIGTDVSNEKAAEAEKHIEQTYGIPSKIFGCYSVRFGVLSIVPLVRKVAKLSRDIISGYRPTHIWTDSCLLSAIGRKIAKEQGAVSVFDVQAISAEEIALRRGRGIGYWIIRWKSVSELNNSDRLAGVSHKLKQWVQNWTGRDDLVVIPCCFDSKRFYFNEQARKKVRQELGFGDGDKVICYSGGLTEHQRIPDILGVCHQISKMRGNFKFLFLTQQAKQLQQMVKEKEVPIERCVIKSCMPQEVPQCLSAADAGIIMRNDIPVNNVASPIKIGEYLGCGLPVILTKGIGDYSEMLPEAGVGIVLDENGNMAEQVVGFIEGPNFGELRQKAIAFARENISWDSHLDDLKRLFNIEASTGNRE